MTRSSPHPFSREHRHFETIDSTNRYALDEATRLSHGSIITADLQTLGRGRLGRRWVTPPGRALLMTLFLKPDWPLDQLGQLTMIAGLAAAEAMEQSSRCQVRLKWPNDLIIIGQDPVIVGQDRVRKCGGILLESRMENDSVAVAVGMGINVNLETADLPDAHTPPTSLFIEGGSQVDRDGLMHRLVDRFEAYYRLASAEDSPLAAWSDRLHTLGQDVTVTPAQGGDPWHGRALRVNRDGQLVIKSDSGTERTVSAGDVTLRIST